MKFTIGKDTFSFTSRQEAVDAWEAVKLERKTLEDDVERLRKVEKSLEAAIIDWFRADKIKGDTGTHLRVEIDTGQLPVLESFDLLGPFICKKKLPDILYKRLNVERTIEIAKTMVIPGIGWKDYSKLSYRSR